jgi:hypothetical protein
MTVQLGGKSAPEEEQGGAERMDNFHGSVLDGKVCGVELVPEIDAEDAEGGM